MHMCLHVCRLCVCICASVFISKTMPTIYFQDNAHTKMQLWKCKYGYACINVCICSCMYTGVDWYMCLWIWIFITSGKSRHINKDCICITKHSAVRILMVSNCAIEIKSMIITCSGSLSHTPYLWGGSQGLHWRTGPQSHTGPGKILLGWGEWKTLIWFHRYATHSG